MSRARKILAVIEPVKLTVRDAAIHWNATDIRGIEASVAAITGSVQPLRAALDREEVDRRELELNRKKMDKREIAGNLSAAELRSAAQALRKEAATLERLVDAAAAFVRSGPGLFSDGGPAYTFGGEIGPVASRPTESYAG